MFLHRNKFVFVFVCTQVSVLGDEFMIDTLITVSFFSQPPKRLYKVLNSLDNNDNKCENTAGFVLLCSKTVQQTCPCWCWRCWRNLRQKLKMKYQVSGSVQPSKDTNQSIRILVLNCTFYNDMFKRGQLHDVLCLFRCAFFSLCERESHVNINCVGEFVFAVLLPLLLNKHEVPCTTIFALFNVLANKERLKCQL